MATTTELADLERPSKAAHHSRPLRILAIIVIATAINYMDRANLSIAAPIVKKQPAHQRSRVGADLLRVLVDLRGPADPRRMGPRPGRAEDYLRGRPDLLVDSHRVHQPGQGIRLPCSGCGSPWAWPRHLPFPPTIRWSAGGSRPRSAALATGSYTAGEYVGLAIAAPLLAWMAVTYGWHSVFYLTGGLGFVFAFVWLIFIRNSPQSDKRVSDSEIDLIEKGGGAVAAAHAEGDPAATRSSPTSRSSSATSGWSAR